MLRADETRSPSLIGCHTGLFSFCTTGKAEKIRLKGIDCPEKRQAFGQRAKQFTSKLAFGQDVTVKT
ncbi:thermonuclease family protein [Nitrospira sp. Nam74]